MTLRSAPVGPVGSGRLRWLRWSSGGRLMSPADGYGWSGASRPTPDGMACRVDGMAILVLYRVELLGLSGLRRPEWWRDQGGLKNDNGGKFCGSEFLSREASERLESCAVMGGR